MPSIGAPRALVQNHGSLGVAAGVKVSFHAGTSAAGMLIADAATKTALLPGQGKLVGVDYPVPVGAANPSFYVAVDGATPGKSSVSECLEDNNSASVDGVTCPMLQ